MIHKWSIYIKQPIEQYNDMTRIKKRIAEIQKGESGYKWTKTLIKEDHYKIIGERKSFDLEINEKILIIYYPMKSKNILNISYEINGSKWNDLKWSRIANLYKSKLESNSVFYTVEGSTSINEQINKEAMNLLKSFSGKKLQSLSEDNFISLSAFTDRFQTKLPLGNNQFMNLHIAYRNSANTDNNVKVTIGTPIITSEY